MNLIKHFTLSLACGALLGPGVCPGGVFPVTPKPSRPTLGCWLFSDTNTWASNFGYAPVSFTNLDASPLGDRTALLLDSPEPAWLRYNIFENGATNLTVDTGGLTFWFAPSWAGTNEGGTGPGDWGRLIEVGSYTPDASYGWWSLYVDPAGANLYFSAQTNDGSGTTYLSAPIDWSTNRWHMLGLSYTATNSVLYIDGVLVTNGPGVMLWPGLDVLAQGFCIGSDSDGLAQARGMFDDLHTYSSPLNSVGTRLLFELLSVAYYGNSLNGANLSQAPSAPQVTPVFEAVTGPGYLNDEVWSGDCVTNSNVWFTNVVAVMAANQTMNVSFTIMGGSNGLPYDVFANALLGPTGNTNYQWRWQGQGYSCHRYTLTNLPNASAYLVLGTPLDSDSDGLTDAFELLVSKSDPHNPDSSNDGMLDGWKYLWGLDARTNNPALSWQRSNYTYDPVGFLKRVSDKRPESFILDSEGNVTSDQ